MIKFFRHIRKDLVEKTKTSKYLKYAIGEIILVVFGILIALQINNWNETQKKQNELKSVYKLIKLDLQKDIITIHKVLDIMKPKEKYFNQVLYQKLDFQAYKNCKPCQRIIMGYPDFKLQNKGLNQLSAFHKDLNDKQTQLNDDINNFYDLILVEIEIDEHEISLDFSNNYMYWKENTNWLADFMLEINEDDFINYALNAQDYRNRVANFYDGYYNIYLPHLESYTQGAREIITTIETYLEAYD